MTCISSCSRQECGSDSTQARLILKLSEGKYPGILQSLRIEAVFFVVFSNGEKAFTATDNASCAERHLRSAHLTFDVNDTRSLQDFRPD